TRDESVFQLLCQSRQERRDSKASHKGISRPSLAITQSDEIPDRSRSLAAAVKSIASPAPTKGLALPPARRSTNCTTHAVRHGWQQPRMEMTMEPSRRC